MLSQNEAFTDAKKIFASTVTDDNRKKNIALQAVSLDDLKQAAAKAKAKYERHHENKAAKWLTKFSFRVRHYGNILDVLTQHHPEYVSLAWGAMKLIFGVSASRKPLVMQ
ncbi:MAG: hypothetical protein Q9160_006058 [Pyrenula sp. 1 TL-2023]